ncbi:MAG: transglutaminase domain-containing protein [Nannocystaceae bacterium]
MTSSDAGADVSFRDRAQLEAARYGSDSWVFVRELLQNARDAGATEVRWTIESIGERVRVTCHDNGEGMDLDHARRYLFSLYTSSKEQEQGQIGCFGVGFWSILRFTPLRIVVRSGPRRGSAWEIELDGELRHATQRISHAVAGTQVVLEKRAARHEIVDQIARTATCNARFLSQRDHPQRPILVWINDRTISESFDLPRPSSHFVRGKVRGVVSLGDQPRVELFSGGLRVRTAVDLDELLSGASSHAHSQPGPHVLPGGLCPVILLESPDLDLLLARRDARETRSLRKLVRLARRELRHLVARQIDRARPPTVMERIEGLFRCVHRLTPARRLAVAGLGGSALGVALLAVSSPEPARTTDAPPVGTPTQTGISGDRPVYEDLARHYRGPQVSAFQPGAHGPPIGLRYRPAQLPHQFRVLVADQFDLPLNSEPTGTAYRSQACDRDCTQVELEYRNAGGYMRVPVPTGHRLDTSSVRVDDLPVPVYRTTSDEPVLYFSAPTRGRMTYATGPGRPQRVGAGLAPIALPAALQAEAEALRREPVPKRVQRLRDLTRRRVQYRTTSDVAAAHERARAAGQGFIARALSIAAGDCDVQNGLFVALLRAAGVPSRLAIGYLGVRGGVYPWLHAWVEYRDGDGPWRIADASEPAEVYGPLATADQMRQAVAPTPTGSPTRTPVSSAHGPPATIVAKSPSLPAQPQLSTAASQSPRSSPAAQMPSATVEPPAGSIPDPIPDPAATPTATGSPPLLTRTTTTATATPWSVDRDLWPLLALSVFVVSGAAFKWGTRTRRAVKLGDASAIATMLSSALARPERFRDLPMVLERPLIPVHQGGALSLQQAITLSLERRLYRATASSDLARRADRRAAIIDGATSEGAMVADTLGATDLDRWSQLLEQSERAPLLDQLGESLADQGEKWTLRMSSSVTRPVEMLDLRQLGLRGRKHDRVVLIQRSGPELQAALSGWSARPATSALGLLDHVLGHLDLPDARRQLLLSASARDAVAEAAR